MTKGTSVDSVWRDRQTDISDRTIIESVEAWACSLPLPHPLDFGGFSISSRQYVAVRVTTSGGFVADCIGLSRCAPVDVAILDVIAPHVVGRDALGISQRLDDVASATRSLEQDGVLGKARSLVDICLWDLLAQAAGMPLWQLFGGEALPLPVLLVEGYRIPDESDDDFVDRLTRRVDEGYTGLKLEVASYHDPSRVETVLRKLRRQVGSDVQIVVDLLFTWRDGRYGARAGASWCDHDLAWIEDPLPLHRVDEWRRLRADLAAPLAAGDEVTRPRDLVALLDGEALDVLRLDATTQGGVTAARELLAHARTRDRRVSSHVHPDIHRHLAFATPAIDHIEAFPGDDRFDRTHSLLRVPFMSTVRDGLARAPDEPGTGLRLDIDAVRRAAHRYGAVKMEEARP